MGRPKHSSRRQRHGQDSPGAAGVCTLGRLVTASDAMRAVLEAVKRLAQTDVTVTLVGETGTGKDVLASALHDASRRARGPFVVFDCGSVTASLAESELLGHERGAFTGALSAHAGAFERADGGTLFLDEIGELPLDLQPRLLRVLESRRVRRVGGSRDRSVDVRVVAATNRDLQVEVSDGGFRQDLYFRLAAALIAVPALRHRVEDLPLLAPRLLADLGHPNVVLDAAAYELLSAHNWPGNVRELKNVLAYAVALADDARDLTSEHLRQAWVMDSDAAALERLPFAGQRLVSIERAAIRQTLAETGGNKAQAAKVLGIAVSTLYEKLKRHGL